MSVTSGFYNSLNHDRLYDAIQLSKLFDGIINDGIFASIGTNLIVTAGTGNTVNVGIGKAWFNHSWLENDAILPITLPNAELLLDRIDTIVLDFDGSELVRFNDIKVITGTASSTPARPELVNINEHHQYALCYILRKANSESIVQADITNIVGTEATPFITGLMQVTDLNTVLGQWQSQLNEFVANETKMLHEAFLELDTWTENEESSFLNWFENIKNQLSTDQAGHLQNEIYKEEITRILTTGLLDGQKTISDDGTIIYTVGSTGQSLEKTFTNGFLTCTSILKDSSNSIIGQMTKTFSSDGKTINTSITIY